MPAPRSQLAGNLLALLASVLILALLFGLLEGGLRVAGIGARDPAASRLAYQRIYLPMLEQAARPDGTRVWTTWDPRLPFQSLLAARPEGALRIVTFGGSATAGLGFSPNVTFSRHLERMLVEAMPGRPVEVLNLGIVALSSRQVKVLVADACAQLEPDVVIVYSGNNEFLELHAEKYAAANRSPLGSLTELLERSNLLRALRLAIYGRPKPPSLAERDLSQEDLRTTQAQIIEDIEVEPDEIRQVVDAYQENLEEMVDAALAAGARPLLVSVASNWRWRGRSDLPDDWMAELVPAGADGEAPDPAEVRAAIEARLAEAAAPERSALLFQRAVVEERLGDFGAARDSYRAAMNQDPHLRRALDAMNERVGSVARSRGVAFVDAVEVMAADADHGIVGFEQFYDYVHFTPRGAIVLAEALFAELVEMGVVPGGARAVAGAYRERRLRALGELERDPTPIGEWMGVGFDPERAIADRDLWKYDRLLGELDARIEADPRDALAIVYRANADAFRLGGAEDAERGYRAALALRPGDAAIRANLEHLEAERRLVGP